MKYTLIKVTWGKEEKWNLYVQHNSCCHLHLPVQDRQRLLYKQVLLRFVPASRSSELGSLPSRRTRVVSSVYFKRCLKEQAWSLNTEPQSRLFHVSCYTQKKKNLLQHLCLRSDEVTFRVCRWSGTVQEYGGWEKVGQDTKGKTLCP